MWHAHAADVVGPHPPWTPRAVAPADAYRSQPARGLLNRNETDVFDSMSILHSALIPLIIIAPEHAYGATESVCVCVAVSVGLCDAWSTSVILPPAQLRAPRRRLQLERSYCTRRR